MPETKHGYDEFGIPGSVNQGRFQYTGQKWLPERGMYDYKARMYSPTLGRFMQTDPIGYADGVNWYNYVGSDPINATDPTGLYDGETCNTAMHFDATTGSLVPNNPNDINVCGRRLPGLLNPFPFGYNYGAVGSNGTPDRNYGGGTGTPAQKPKTPTCGNGLAAKIANVADKVSLYSGGVAAGAGLAGLVAAPTGAGFVFFEGVAGVSGLVSLGASGVGAVAHFANRDYVGGLLDIGGAVGGFGVGKLAGNALASTRTFGNLSASQARQAALASNGAGTAAGAASSLYNCR